MNDMTRTTSESGLRWVGFGNGERRWGMRFRSGWDLVILLILALTSLTGDAINPGCRCIRFVSTFGKEWGSFGSPDYPGDYPRGIHCLLYLFSAPQDFIVQLNFSHIHLPTTSNGCQSGDYLKLFLHLDSEGVNESTPWNSLICGERSNETYYSASQHLVIQFHSGSAFIQSPRSEETQLSAKTQEFHGFNGFFRFLNSSQFESNGRLVAGTKCDFVFESRNYSSPEGKFFSPFYPSNYPHNVMCAYSFRARLHERVKVVFESVALEAGVYSCLNKTDVIRVFDGSTSRSPVPVIALICNAAKDYELVSSGQELLVEFIGNSDTPGKGFRAKFHFIKVIYDDPYDPLRFNLQQYFPKLDIPKSIGEDGQPQASTLVPQCDSMIHSDNGPNGSLSSPSYPNAYPPKSHCRFDLIGHGRQRVQLSFVDFHLFHSDKIYIPRHSSKNANNSAPGNGSDKKCPYSDSISSFIYINGIRTKVLEHCGENPPPDMMSNDHRMTLEFNAKASTTTPSVRGFYAHYSFVEDFGMKSGLQASGYPCAFIFNISSHPNGTISSPNYPGLYPWATECHYFFHGDEAKGFIQLSFDHFDISGTMPCDKESDDYLEFGNYMPTDPRFGRKCGQNLVKDGHPTLKIGGGGRGKFFRVTFRSNDGWGDGTGFHAEFTFRREINQITTTTVNGIIAAQAKLSPSTLLLFLVVKGFGRFVLI